MNWLRQLLQRLRSSFSNQQADLDLDAEMESHLAMSIEENMKRGMSEQEAWRQARVQLGGVEQTKQHQRDARGLPGLDILWLDLRYTFRAMRRDPMFTLVAVLILMLGIGANIAVFSVVNTILLRPLPFRDAQQLVRIVEKGAQGGESGRTYTADATEDFQQQNRSFQSVSGYFAFTGPNNFKLSGNGQPTPATGMLVAQGFFETLGVDPAVARIFQPEEFVHHAQPAALLSYPYWKRQFGGDRSIIGRTVDLSDKVDLNNGSVTVVGVLPETFDFGAVFSPGAKIDLFVPYIMDDYRNDGNDLALVGRLKPGVSIAQAQSETVRDLGPGVWRFPESHC